MPALYNAEYLFYRPGGTSSSRVSDVALHLYPIAGLRIEILGQFGDDGVNNVVGGRPAAIYDVGFLKLRAALEYQYRFAEDPAPTATNTIKSRGGAGSAQVVFAPYIEAGLNFGAAVIDAVTPRARTRGSPETVSATAARRPGPAPQVLPNLMLGGGLNYATFHNLIRDADRTIRALDQPAVVRGGAVPVLQAALREIRRRVRQVALRKQGDHVAVRRRHVQLPRPRAVPVLIRF